MVWFEEYRCTSHPVIYLPSASVRVPLNVRERCIIYYFTLLQNEHREVFQFSCNPGTDHVSPSCSFNSSFNTQSGLCCFYTLLIDLFGSLPNDAFDIEIGCIFEYKADHPWPTMSQCLCLWKEDDPVDMVKRKALRWWWHQSCPHTYQEQWQVFDGGMLEWKRMSRCKHVYVCVRVSVQFRFLYYVFPPCQGHSG